MPSNFTWLSQSGLDQEHFALSRTLKMAKIGLTPACMSRPFTPTAIHWIIILGYSIGRAAVKFLGKDSCSVILFVQSFCPAACWSFSEIKVYLPNSSLISGWDGFWSADLCFAVSFVGEYIHSHMVSKMFCAGIQLWAKWQGWRLSYSLLLSSIHLQAIEMT